MMFIQSAKDSVYLAGRDSLVNSYYRKGIDPPEKEFYPVRYHFFENVFDAPISEYTLPIHRDSIKDKRLEIELHLTNSHWRETYYIDIRPGMLDTKKEIYSRYFSH